MGSYLLTLGTVMYVGVAFDYWNHGDYFHAWIFTCYAGANVGFILHLRGLS